MNRNELISQLPTIHDGNFEEFALNLFLYQAQHVTVYKNYVSLLHINPNKVNNLNQIPFLPIGLFKTHEVFTDEVTPCSFFQSSGTTQSVASKHFYHSTVSYHQNSLRGFEKFFGSIKQYHILALLPSYSERTNSSLISMVDFFMDQSSNKQHGYFLNDYESLFNKLIELQNEKVILIGVSFALFEFAKHFNHPFSNLSIIETGGMKGRGKELTRQELHDELKASFKLSNIFSEYGMTELFSQAWTKGGELFHCIDTMKVFCRDITDPFNIISFGESGALNIIDLANIDSCAFIATDDLGIAHSDKTFEVRGRIDNSDIRGCNLMV